MSSQDIIFTGGKPELGDLIKAACKSFELIEPWFLAVSDHKDVQPIIMEVRRQGNNYYDALDRSFTVARNGFGLSDDCEKLCEYLEDMQNGRAEPSEVRDMVLEMKKSADSAHKEALVVCNMFRSVREGLMQVSESIKTRVQIEEANAPAAPAHQKKKGIGGFFRGLLKMPDKLPVTEMVSNYNKKDNVAKRSASVRNANDLIDWLKQASEDIRTLEPYVSKYADWWVATETQLGNVEMGIAQLNSNRLMKLRVRAVRKSWMDVRSEYQTYISRMTLLQDYYPDARNRLIQQ